MPYVGVRLDEALASVGLIQAGVEINRTASMPMMNAWRPAYRALGDRARAAGARVTMTGEGGDEWLTVGPEYMVDLLRRFDLAGLNRMLGTILRSYDTNRTLLLYNMLWRFCGRPLLASWGRDLLRHAAPKQLHAHRLSQLEARSPAWVSPSPDLQRELRVRMERWTDESLKVPEPSGPFGFYLSTLPAGFLHPLRSLDCEEVFQSRRRTGVRELQPYWDADLDPVPLPSSPHDSRQGRTDKGLVRDQSPNGFRLGVRTSPEGVGEHVFLGTDGRRGAGGLGPAWRRQSLAALGIVDPRKAEETARANITQLCAAAIFGSGRC